MKRMSYFVMALALVVGFTQCNKEQPTPQAESVRITLNVGDGSKATVTTGFTDPDTGETYAKVEFDENDTIYVGNNGKYCGKLVYNATSHTFSGEIAPESQSDYLHFYFMGNKTPLNVVDVYKDGNKIGYTATEMNPVINSTATFSVNITDQTVKYPVISYAHSTQTYTSGVTTYNAKLQNYCSIMKFTTTDLPIDNPITISGMLDKVTVNFAANNGATTGDPYSYAKMGITDEGDITLHAESETERWAIVLPYQYNVNTAGASAQGCYSLTSITIPWIGRNVYYASGKANNGWINLPIVVNLSHLIDGAFSINKGDAANNIPPTQVFFASGNLQCTTEAEPDANGEYDWSSAAYTWSFKTHQYDIDNSNAFDVGENCKKVNTISHFNWATSGWNNTANDALAYNFQPYATDFADSTQHPTNRYHYGPTRRGEAAGDTVSIMGNYAKYDWGVYCSYTGDSPYKIYNGGEYSWRLLTEKEQTYILGPNTNPRPGDNCRLSSTVNGVPNARFIKACLTDASNGEGQGLYGLIIFPDTYTHPSSAPLPQKINDPNSTFTDNNYTIAQWTAMETDKAVFLPAAGCRWGQISSGVNCYKIQDINKHCYYWSSSDDASHASTHAKNMRIGLSDFVSSSYTQRVRGNCVRLVRIATSADE